MSLDHHIEKGDDHYIKHYGMDKETFLRKARARTWLMTRICQQRGKRQTQTQEMLNRVIDL